MVTRLLYISLMLVLFSAQVGFSAPFFHSPIKVFSEATARHTGRSEEEIRQDMVEAFRESGKFSAEDLERIGRGEPLTSEREIAAINLLKTSETFKARTGLDAIRNEKITSDAAAAFSAMRTGRMRTLADQAVLAFAERNGPGWTVVGDFKSGYLAGGHLDTSEMVFMAVMASPGQLVHAAKQFVVRNADLFGLNPDAIDQLQISGANSSKIVFSKENIEIEVLMHNSGAVIGFKNETMSPLDLANLRKIKAAIRPVVERISGFSGIGIGEHGIRVYVKNQADLRNFEYLKFQLPYPIEFVVIGDIVAQGVHAVKPRPSRNDDAVKNVIGATFVTVEVPKNIQEQWVDLLFQQQPPHGPVSVVEADLEINIVGREFPPYGADKVLELSVKSPVQD